MAILPAVKNYIYNILHALDILLNVLFAGEEGQTVSARWGAAPSKTVLFHWGCKFLDFVTRTEHCKEAHEKYAKMREAVK